MNCEGCKYHNIEQDSCMFYTEYDYRKIDIKLTFNGRKCKGFNYNMNQGDKLDWIIIREQKKIRNLEEELNKNETKNLI